MINKVNPDLAKERANAVLDVEKMKPFLGEFIYDNLANYQKMLKYRDELVKDIKPLYEENFFNLDRDEKYQIVFKKSLELIEWVLKNKCEDAVSVYLIGAVLGVEKILFNLHYTMFKDACEVWGTAEQSKYWQEFMEKNSVFGTYVQTEIGHGTYLRALETTATYDKNTQEFVIDSPTLTSIKFWPGSAGKSCNFAIVMAKLIIDNQDHGIHAFIVQLRSLIDHKSVPGVELGDIGKKFGFDATDNGYVKFNKLRIPRFNMLMQFAQVTPEGNFQRVGSELLMYAAMLLMRGILSQFGSYYLSISTTIAIRYSAVRRQTLNMEGVESQILDYQTQQYRLFPSLAATYAYSFTGWTLKRILVKLNDQSNRFKNIDPNDLAKLHAVISGLKSVIFGDCLKFAQSNRLCCGGHGYSASSGLSQIIQEADAACTYEGDNVVLLLQTARYLLKCAQKGISPHLELENINELKSTNIYKKFQKYVEIFERLFEESVNEITGKMFRLVKEENVAPLTAWNQTSHQLITVARVYIELFIINANISCIYSNKVQVNQSVLSELFELYLLYAITDTHSANILRFNVLDSNQITVYREDLLNLLPKIRVNAVALVDSFDMLDSNLCSSLGAYDGNVYERLFEFAKASKFNEKDVHDAYDKYLKPYMIRNKNKAKL